MAWVERAFCGNDKEITVKAGGTVDSGGVSGYNRNQPPQTVPLALFKKGRVYCGKRFCMQEKRPQKVVL